MKGVRVVESKDQAYDTIAQVLHTQRKKVAALAMRRKHPLPLSILIDSSHENALQQNFEEVLSQWISEERQIYGAVATEYLDLERAESELTERIAKNTYHQDWTIERCLDSYPPGHFLG